MVKRSSAALQSSAQSKVKQSNLLLRLVWCLAGFCFVATLAVVYYPKYPKYPKACACASTAVATAHMELGWLFWLLLLDILCVAAACVVCCQMVLQVICSSHRIWSASSSESLCHYLKSGHIFQGRVKSHVSKATAFATHTMMNATRQFKALLWLLTVYPLTLFIQVGHLLLSCLPVAAFCLTTGSYGCSSQ